ncbi:MAG: hypothetical protein GX600_07660 [Dehalococcoidia bacterium]|nr:hypothetical protein [Dehalococcoidia bacterium]
MEMRHGTLAFFPMNEAQVRAIELLAQEYDFGWGSLHAHKVADLATSIFDQLSSLGLAAGMTLDDRRTLMAAGYAHDIGASARAQIETSPMPGWIEAFTEPDRHGEMAFYLLHKRLSTSSAERLLGTLTPGDRSSLLYCLLWHASPAMYVLDIEPLFDRSRALLLAGILRVADGLDCEHRLRVRDVQIQKASAWLRMLVRHFAPADEEIARAKEKSDILSMALCLRVFVQQIVED